MGRWSLEPSKYSVSSLRDCIDNASFPQSNGCWSWNNFVTGRLNIFTWRICHRKLPTMENISKFGISNSTACKMCNNATENEDPVFVVCSITKSI
uniref:Reverse transcriptase zinc-binding domain-containing protein n=1 Tax=Lactuca sativa TaxID=4236 RepID=A0A9R1XWD5_LACSA|nr:hypothetical protein LSAT_V11C200096370 [Lactuca sativa]